LKQLRTIIVSMLAGALLATAGTTFGAEAYKKISATLRPDLAVKVDGEKVKLQNAPLTYNGTTYVPLREAGQILGATIGYNAGTITIDSKENQPASKPATETVTEEWIPLKNLSSFGITAEIGQTQADGKSYGIKLTGNGITIEFPRFHDNIDRNVLAYYESADETKTIAVKYVGGEKYFSLEHLRRCGLIAQ